METVGYILTALALAWVWDTKKDHILLKKHDELTMVPRNKFFGWIANAYLPNCSTCIMFWTGLILFFVFDYQIFFIPLPLYYGLINKHL